MELSLSSLGTISLEVLGISDSGVQALEFLSLGYLVFLAFAFLVQWLCPARGRVWALLVCSLAFYATWNPACVICLFITIVSTYLSGTYLQNTTSAAGGCMENNGARCRNGQPEDDPAAGAHSADAMAGSAAGGGKRRLILILAIVLNLGILIYCKYWGMLFPGAMDNRLLPVGISFYTLQSLGYVVDCYHGRGMRIPFWEYAAFVSFFPGITSGPIERSNGLLRQIHELQGRRREGIYEDLRNGAMIMLWGYFLKMVLADRIAIAVNAVYGDLASWKGTMVVLAVLLYSLQIYCDFAGYSAIAIGSARILGLRMMQNFRAPYLERSVASFWRRWHISLSTWFRDYLYIPLGGNRKGTLRKYLNLLIVFAVSGLWHGADITFLIWGLLHGVYQVAGYVLKPLRKRICGLLGINRKSLSHRLLQVAVTYLLVSVAWIFFRADSCAMALDILRSMRGIHLWQLGDGSLLKLGLDTANWILLAAGLLVLLMRDVCVHKGISVREVICRQGLWLRYLLFIGGVLLVLVCGIWGPGYDAATFIYSQF